MKIKRAIAGVLLAGAMAMQMGINAGAESYTLTFTTGDATFSGSALCTFYNTETGEQTTKTVIFENGVGTLPIDDTGTYNVMDYTLFDVDGSFITQEQGYSYTGITGNISINYDVAGKLAITQQEEQVDSIAQLAGVLGISYEEAYQMVQTGSGDSYDTAPVTTKPVGETTTGNEAGTDELKSYTFTLDYGNVEWLYGVDNVDITHNGSTERVSVIDGKFDYVIENGTYELKAEGFVTTKLNVEGNVATKVVMKPERIVYLLKNTDRLNLVFDGMEWSGALVDGKVAMGILPTDSVVIDDVDGLAYRLPVQPGVHEYTLDLGTGVTSGIQNEKPTADITEDNPFGIPQTNDRTVERVQDNIILGVVGILGMVSCVAAKYGKKKDKE